MTSRTLILLYNPITKKYVDILPEPNQESIIPRYIQSCVCWCENWMEAHDFSDMFIFKRIMNRIRWSKELGVKLKWKRVIVFEGRGLV